MAMVCHDFIRSKPALTIVNLCAYSILMMAIANPLTGEAQDAVNPNPSSSTQAPLSLPTTGRLVLKACCGDTDQQCDEFSRPEEMFGIACCGQRPINQFEEICCDNVARRRRTPSAYIDRCCGNQTLAYDQTCCQGVVHNIPNGECCGAQAYPRNNLNVLCCNGVLNPNVEPGRSCCGTTPYDGGIKETCCGGLVVPKELFDGCCPVQGSNPPEFRQFSSKTHQCCDVPIERFSKTKCCYLRNKKSKFSQFVPTSYDSSTSCCAYPYDSITPKKDGSCIAAIPSAASRDDPNAKPPTTENPPVVSPPTDISPTQQSEPSEGQNEGPKPSPNEGKNVPNGGKGDDKNDRKEEKSEKEEEPEGGNPENVAPGSNVPEGNGTPGNAPEGNGTPGNAPEGNGTPGNAPEGNASGGDGNPGNAPGNNGNPGNPPGGSENPGNASERGNQEGNQGTKQPNKGIFGNNASGNNPPVEGEDGKNEKLPEDVPSGGGDPFGEGQPQNNGPEGEMGNEDNKPFDGGP